MTYVPSRTLVRIAASTWIGRSLFVGTLLCLAACDTRTPLANVEASPEALGRRVLAAVERRDIDGLRNLALSEREFREHVWPELPAARPERNLPFAYVWGDLHQKSAAALVSTLAEFGGRQLELVSVRSAGAVTQYNSYIVRRQTELTVRDEAGNLEQIRLFGSMIEQGGAFKVFSFVVDD